jgi:hypothetical protein
MVIIAGTDCDSSVVEVAMIVTAGGLGGASGAAYIAVSFVEARNEPHAGLHEIPLWVIDHVTPWFLESFCTVAVNCWLWDTETELEVGETDTDIGGESGAVSTIWAEEDFVASETDIAVSVTAGGCGSSVGAE